MTTADIVIVAASAATIILLTWYFFGPKKARVAEVREGVQDIGITVRGGYTPDLIHVRQGVPVRLRFDRQESGDCTSRACCPTSASTPLCPRSARPPSSSPRTRRATSASAAACT